MANPLKVKYSGETFAGLQVMTNEEMDYTVHQILTEFVANTGPGNITTDSSHTSIGSFVDTARTENVGQSTPSGATSTVSTTTVYQNQATDSDGSDEVKPLEFVSNTYPLQVQSDTNLNASIITRALANLVANGVGSYVMQPTQPNSQYTSILTLTNTVTGNGTASNNTTQIWRRTSGAAPSTVYPLKLGSNTGSISEYSNTDIALLISRFRNQMMSTGIGKYVLQENAPGTGTWVRQGSAFTDTRHIFGNSKNYVKTYTKTYTKDWSTDYQKDYSTDYNKQYGGTYEKAYAKLYGNSYEKIWSKDYGATYTKVWDKVYTKTYDGDYTKTYTKIWAGEVDYSKDY